MDDYIRTVLGLAPVFSDSILTVYRNDQIE